MNCGDKLTDLERILHMFVYSVIVGLLARGLCTGVLPCLSWFSCMVVRFATIFVQRRIFCVFVQRMTPEVVELV